MTLYIQLYSPQVVDKEKNECVFWVR